MEFEFVHPAGLLLACTCWWVWRVARRQRPGPVQGRLRSVRLCRLLALVSLAIALAQPILYYDSRQLFVVFVPDVSASVTPTARDTIHAFMQDAIASEPAASFASQPFAQRPATLSLAALNTEPPAPVADRRTNIGLALMKSAASVPIGYTGRIVLLSDGRQNLGDGLRAALGMGLPVDTVPVYPVAGAEVGIVEINTMQAAYDFEWFPVEVVLFSTSENMAELTLSRNGELVEKRSIALGLGIHRETFYVQRRSGASVQFSSEVAPRDDQRMDNNRILCLVPSRKPSRTLILSEQPMDGFSTALEAAGFAVETLSPGEWQDGGVRLNAVDLLVLSDVAASDLSDKQTDALATFAKQAGGGVLVLGGTHVFGSDLSGTKLETLLPVNAKPLEDVRPSLALVLVVDKSSSMLEQQRLELAKEAARKSVSLLAPTDLVGVIAFGDDTPWVYDLSACGNAQHVRQEIDSLRASGRTNMYPALRRAQLALEQAAVDRKHVIVLTDGVASPGDFEQVAGSMAKAKITLSTVSISAGAEQSLLKDLARRAGGRHYHCENPQDVPSILVQETRNAVEGTETFAPQRVRPLPWLSLQGAPPLNSYAPTNAKENVEVVVTVPNGDPLLAWWKVGRGTVTVVTTDEAGSGAGSGGWLSWRGSHAFWTCVADLTRRTYRPRDVVCDVLHRIDKTLLRVDVSNHDWHSQAQIDIRLAPGEAPDEVPDDAPAQSLDLVAPGRFECALIAPTAPQVATITVDRPGQVQVRQMLGLLPEDEPESTVQDPDTDFLEQLAHSTGGRVQVRADEVFARQDRVVRRKVELWAPCFFVSLFLLLCEIGLRRTWRPRK